MLISIIETLDEKVLPAAVVATDLIDYAPGSTACITASNFSIGKDVTFKVSHVLDAGADGVYGTYDDTIDEAMNASGSGHEPWTVTDGGADDLDGKTDGNVTTSWYVNPDDSDGARFLLTAAGISSEGDAVIATNTFTDASPIGNVAKNYQHWADGDPAQGTTADWNGDILSDNKSNYFEGEVIPQVYVAQSSTKNPLVKGQSYSFDINYNYYNSSGNASGFDYITTYNISRTPGLLPKASGRPPVEDTTTTSGNQGLFYSVDADITSATSPTYSSPTGTRDGIVQVIFTYTGTTSVSNEQIVEIYFGLHIAQPGGAGSGTNGASAYPGGSLQTTINNSIFSGAQSTQMAPSAIEQGVISGVKFNDLNGNGTNETGESALAGWTIYLDTNNNSVKDTGEPSVVTSNGSQDVNNDGTIDPIGTYIFNVTPDSNKSTPLTNDPYIVREVMQSGWSQTAPAAGFYSDVISASKPQYLNQNFGNIQEAPPSISITKAHTGTINEGTSSQTLTYTFVVSNTSTSTTDPVEVYSLTDTILGDLLSAFKAANGGNATLAYGASKAFTVNYTAPVANAGAVVANTVSVSGKDDEGNSVTASASDSETYKDVAPSIIVSKVANVTSVQEGGVGNQSVTYTYTVTNSSSSSTDPVTLTSIIDDKLSAYDLLSDAILANGGSAVLAPGASVTFTETITVPVENANYELTNRVDVFGMDDEKNTATGSAKATVTYSDVKPTSIVITKSHQGIINEGTSGQILTYKFTVSDDDKISTDPLTISYLWDDKIGNLLPAFIATNGSNTLKPGGSMSFTMNYTAPINDAGEQIKNTVSVTAHDDEGNPTSDSASDIATYENLAPTINVTKTPDKTTVTVSGSVTYSYLVTNTSPAGEFDPLSGVSLSDDDGTPTYVSGDNGDGILQVGETWAYSLTVVMTGAGSHTNTVNATGTDDENSGCNSNATVKVTVDKASPTLTTLAGPSNIIYVSGTSAPTITDTATFSGSYLAGGNITFTLQDTATGNTVYTTTVPVNGDGTYSVSTNNVTVVGVYVWTATYKGDNNNKTAVDQGGADETLEIRDQVDTGEAATLGFWSNKNGQALLTTYTAKDTSSIGSWLAKNYCNLFGNLDGATGKDVATYFLKVKGATASLTNNTYAQALTTALSVYVTTSGQGWNTSSTGPMKYGFRQGFGGASLGDMYYNVGLNGASFGYPNDSMVKVSKLLCILNYKCNRTGGSKTELPTKIVFYGADPILIGGANNVFNGINKKGDII